MKTLESEFTELLSHMGKLQGMDDLCCKIFAILYIEPSEISMEELAKKTGYSLASISNKLNMLVLMGMVKKFRKPGSKKLYIFMKKDFIEIIKENLIKKQEYVIKTAKASLPNMLKLYKSKAKTKEDKQKLAIIEGYYKQILTFEKIIEHMVSKLAENR